MKIDMTLKLKDIPGMLLRAMEPISSHGGNIISVSHCRGEKDFVSVHISFKVRDQSSLNLIKNALQRQKTHISELRIEGKKYHTKKSVSFILVGHVIDTDIQDTIDRINTLGMVSDIDVVMPSPEQKSSVMMNVDVDEKKGGELEELLWEICNEKKFLLIRSLN
jgi:ACT domain-containing protein